MSPREASDVKVNADQDWRGGKVADSGRHLYNEGYEIRQRAEYGLPVSFHNVTGRDGDDLAPAAAEDVPPPLVDISLLTHEIGGADENQGGKSYTVMGTADAPNTTTAAPASLHEVAIAASAEPTRSRPSMASAAAKDPDLMDARNTYAATAGDCGYSPGASGSGTIGVAVVAPKPATDLASAASTAASVLKRLASQGGVSSREVAGALDQAAQRLTSAFGAAAPPAVVKTSEHLDVPEADSTAATAGVTQSGLDLESGGERRDLRAAVLTQTASGRMAKVPSACLDLRPHAARAEGAQRLLAAALASVGSLAKAASSSSASRSPITTTAAAAAAAKGEAALASAATALEKALEEIGAAAAEVARTMPEEQEGPEASRGKVSPLSGTAEARDPASLGEVYGNGQLTCFTVPPSPAAAAVAARASFGYEEWGRQGGVTNEAGEALALPFASTEETISGGAGRAGPGSDGYADEAECGVPPGYELVVLNATSAEMIPVGMPMPDDNINPSGGDTALFDAGPIGSPGAYVYDKPDAPPPGVKPAAAVSGFAGAADWAWEDPEVDSPPAPADGGLVPDSPTALHDAEVEAAAVAMPSVIRDAEDPATSPPGAAAAAMYGSRASFSESGSRRAVGNGGNRGGSVAAFLSAEPADPATAAARLPPVPADLDAAAREALGPHALERTAEATAAAMATIAPPRYVTPLPPRLVDILREPSARDLAGVIQGGP